MLDAVLEKLFSPVLDRFALPDGRRAKILQLVAFAISLAAAPLIGHHWVLVGMTVFIAGRVVSALVPRDDDVAEVFNAIALAALPFALVLDAPVRALPAAFLMFGLAANRATALKFGRGLIGSAELVLLFVLVAVLPDWFGLIAYVGGVLCFVAAGIETSRRV